MYGYVQVPDRVVVFLTHGRVFGGWLTGFSFFGWRVDRWA